MAVHVLSHLRETIVKLEEAEESLYNARRAFSASSAEYALMDGQEEVILETRMTLMGLLKRQENITIEKEMT